MGKENIEKYSAGYAIVKLLANIWHNRFFYRRVIILGRENINPADHLIFAPNHQNALMDALAVLFTHKGQPVFLARADIFRKKMIASILYFLKILPIYRIRDGFDSLKSNDWVFNKTIDVIRNKNGLVILPEGNHEGIRRLRQLKKGICRIAFQAEEATGYTLNIKIIPVGLEFTNYSRVRQVLTVVYGKPIEVSQYHQSFTSNPQKAMNELRDRLSEELKKIMVHIDSDTDYEALDELRSIVNGKYSDDILQPKLFRDRILISKLNQLRSSSGDLYNKICDLSLKIKEGARKLNTDYRLLAKKKHPITGMIAGILALVASFPVFLYGLILNVIFLAIPNIPVRKIKDVNFHSSFKYGLSLLLAMLFMPFYLIICMAIVKPWWLGIAVFLTIPMAGLFAWNYSLLYKRIIGGFRVREYIKAQNSDYQLLKSSHEELMRLLSTI